MKRTVFKYLAVTGIMSLAMISVSSLDVHAVMDSPCASCHTMHNSQNDLPMRFGGTLTTPLPQLLRGDCLGCHAQGDTFAIYDPGATNIPQVYHSNAQDLAGGNFAYIDGLKTGTGGGSGSAYGHNLSSIGLTPADGTLTAPPGGIQGTFGHPDGVVINAADMTCAGIDGCHGNRMNPAGTQGITGAHHNNASGAVVQGSADEEPGHGYRFLLGVNGFEDTDWQFTESLTDHNEYYGTSSPQALGCGASGGITCHGNGGVRAPNGTMAEFCATCHGNFHTTTTTVSSGIGNGTSPFIRHPSDYTIPNAGEYQFFNTYLLDTPVARTSVPGSASGAVNPGFDSVMCLSCHYAHAGPNPDMLRWDYNGMEVGNAAGLGTAGTGCFACHSAKE